MAIRTNFVIEVEKNEHQYVYSMPYGVPLQECYDALVDISKELIEFSKEMEEKNKQIQEQMAKTQAGEIKEDDGQQN